MRSFIVLATVISMVPFQAAFAQKGLSKHDASIANHGYSIQIQTGEEPGNSNLKQDIDQGKEFNPQPAGAVAPLGNNLGVVPAAPKPIARQANLQQISPVDVGTQAPDFTLPRANGGSLALKDALAQGPLLVLFTSGTSNPASLRYLQLVQKNLQQFQALGVGIVAITPEPVVVLQQAQRKFQFGFPILNDTNNAISAQYGVLQGYEPVTSLFSVDAAGKIAAIQIQQNPGAAFDLKQATDPLRQQTQAAITAPQAPAVPPLAPATPALDAPIGQVSQDPDLMPQTSAATNPVIPAVPSPQTNKDIPAGNVPKISYQVPPSSPDYVNQVKQSTDQSI